MKEKPIQGKLPYKLTGIKIAIIHSEYNKALVQKLLKETHKELSFYELDDIKIYSVPGALELPVLAKNLVEKKYFNAIIALGVVIKGDTSHYEHVCRESIHGLMRVAIDSGVPIINGIITALTTLQAQERIYRGKEFAQAALKMVKILN